VNLRKRAILALVLAATACDRLKQPNDAEIVKYLEQERSAMRAAADALILGTLDPLVELGYLEFAANDALAISRRRSPDSVLAAAQRQALEAIQQAADSVPAAERVEGARERIKQKADTARAVFK
jgi:hypothetical protein